jgi:hypothetical protein
VFQSPNNRRQTCQHRLRVAAMVACAIASTFVKTTVDKSATEHRVRPAGWFIIKSTLLPLKRNIKCQPVPQPNSLSGVHWYSVQPHLLQTDIVRSYFFLTIFLQLYFIFKFCNYCQGPFRLTW